MWSGAVSLIALLFLWGPSAAAFDEYGYDYRLSRALQRIKMYDFAQRQLAAMLRKYPDRKDAVLIEQARTFFLMGKADQGKACVGRIKPTSRMFGRSRLLLGQMAFRRGDYAAAETAYAGYFSRNSKPPGNSAEERNEFRRAVHEYAAVLKKKGQGAKAAKVLEYLAAIPGSGIGNRQLTVLKGQAVLAAEDEKVRGDGMIDRAAVSRTRQALEALQWQGVDASTAAGLVEAAHASVLLGDYDKAITTLSGATEIFADVEAALRRDRKLAASPVAGAHYYLGRALKGKAFKAFKAGKRDDAKKLLISALRHFYKTTRDYEDSQYATDALTEFGKCKNLLEKQFGVHIKLKTGTVGAGVAVRMRQAEAFYVSKRFSDALPLYLQTVREGGRTRSFIKAAARLTAGYARLGRFLEAQAIAGHLADRFPKSESSAQALLQLGALLYKAARVEKDVAKRERLNADAMKVWGRFVDLAPTHPKAPDIAFAIAENAYGQAARVAARTVKMKAGPDKEKLKARARTLYTQAIPAYQRVIDTFGSAAQGVRALYKLAWIHYTLDQKGKAAPLFARYAENETDPARLDDCLEAKFRSAECLMFTDKAEDAVSPLEELLAWTAPGNDRGVDVKRAKTKELRERVSSYLGWAWDLAAEPFRTKMDALTGRSRELRKEKIANEQIVKQMSSREKATVEQIVRAHATFIEIEHAYSGKVPTAAELAAEAAKAKGKDLESLSAEERKVVERDAAALARRLAAGMASRGKDRLVGEKIQLDKDRETAKRELAAAVEAEKAVAGAEKAGKGGENGVSLAIARGRTAYLRARLAALAAAIEKNTMETKAVQAPPERRPALEAEAKKRTGAALSAWKAALKAQLDYLNAVVADARASRKRAEDALNRVNTELAEIQRAVEPLTVEFKKRKKAAQECFEKFVLAYPKSHFVPDNMARLGTIFVELGQYDRAARTLTALAKKFPKSEAVRRAFFTLGRSECELGHDKRAAAAFVRVLKDVAEQSLANLLYISEKMLAAAHPEQSLAASLEILRRVEQKRGTGESLPPAVGENTLFRAGQARFAQKQYKEALGYYERLLKERPNTAYFFEVKLQSGIARGRLKPPDTTGALRDFGEVLQYAVNKPALVNRALCEAGAIYRQLSGDKNVKLALARYQQVVMLADPGQKENRPWIEEALYRSAECFAKLGRTGDVSLMVARYKKEYPTGMHLKDMQDLARRAKSRGKAAVGAKAGG